MGRKVGRNRSKELTRKLSLRGWDTEYRAIGLTKYQWNNFNNFAETKLLKLAMKGE